MHPAYAIIGVPLIAMTLATACSRSERPSATDISVAPDSVTQHEILAARDAIWKAWFANDTAQLSQLLPEAVAAGQDAGPTQRWTDRAQTTREASEFAAHGGKLVKLDFPHTEIRVSGNVATVFSSFEFETAVGGTTHTTTGHSAEIFVRRNGQWVNPFWHLGA